MPTPPTPPPPPLALNPPDLAFAVDPFTQCYRNLRAVIRADRVLGNTSLRVGIRPANMPDLSDDKFEFLTLKEPGGKGSPNDVPEVLLLSGQFDISLSGTNSKAAEFTQTYPLICSFENHNLQRPSLFKFRLMCAFSRPGVHQLGLPGIVKGVELVHGQDDVLGQQAVKQMQDRWCVFGGVRVHGYVSKAWLAEN